MLLPPCSQLTVKVLLASVSDVAHPSLEQSSLQATESPNKMWQTFSSGFDALVAFASSELDRNRELRRKSLEPDAQPSPDKTGEERKEKSKASKLSVEDCSDDEREAGSPLICTVLPTSAVSSTKDCLLTGVTTNSIAARQPRGPHTPPGTPPSTPPPPLQGTGQRQGMSGPRTPPGSPEASSSPGPGHQGSLFRFKPSTRDRSDSSSCSSSRSRSCSRSSSRSSMSSRSNSSSSSRSRSRSRGRTLHHRSSSSSSDSSSSCDSSRKRVPVTKKPAALVSLPNYHKSISQVQNIPRPSATHATHATTPPKLEKMVPVKNTKNSSTYFHRDQSWQSQKINYNGYPREVGADKSPAKPQTTQGFVTTQPCGGVLLSSAQSSPYDHGSQSTLMPNTPAGRNFQGLSPTITPPQSTPPRPRQTTPQAISPYNTPGYLQSPTSSLGQASPVQTNSCPLGRVGPVPCPQNHPPSNIPCPNPTPIAIPQKQVSNCYRNQISQIPLPDSVPVLFPDVTRPPPNMRVTSQPPVLLPPSLPKPTVTMNGFPPSCYFSSSPGAESKLHGNNSKSKVKVTPAAGLQLPSRKLSTPLQHPRSALLSTPADMPRPGSSSVSCNADFSRPPPNYNPQFCVPPMPGNGLLLGQTPNMPPPLLRPPPPMGPGSELKNTPRYLTPQSNDMGPNTLTLMAGSYGGTPGQHFGQGKDVWPSIGVTSVGGGGISMGRF